MAAAAAAAIAAASAERHARTETHRADFTAFKGQPENFDAGTDHGRHPGERIRRRLPFISPRRPRSSETSGDGASDDLKRIRGIGVLIEKRLNAIGVRHYEQIANWTSGDIDRVSRMLEFKGRIERESWVEQARILASGGQTEFSRRVDRGEVDTSRET